MNIVTRTKVLRSYRQLMKHARALSWEEEARGEDAMVKIQAAFRANMQAKEAEIPKQLAEAKSKLAYLRTIVPKRFRPREEQEEEVQDTGVLNLFYREGEVVSMDDEQLEARSSRKYSFRTLDPEDLKRHKHMMERFHFGHRD